MDSRERRRGMGRQEYTNRLLWGLGNKCQGESAETEKGKIRLRAAEGRKTQRLMERFLFYAGASAELLLNIGLIKHTRPHTRTFTHSQVVKPQNFILCQTGK